eukprot:gnl/MRDRNA2_/MRDRNA2_57672_c0_seq1.p1 gnl/MRDRNA2_/MRDRNA2_57672_c0~~gnl/MRDRNA2_/MRDRNA2_57672_c0_seq1.p1  ORF type:complete len:434 (+),score=86.24 gnl/MRDRNA2_/MRDRNA2_57672_c0_seq1:62-1303(+)
MKTSHAVSVVCQQAGGKVVAVERVVKRHLVLKEIVKKYCPYEKCNVNLVRSNFLLLNPKDYPDVDHIIVDPTCSGSGTLYADNIKASEKTEYNDPQRLNILAHGQSRTLKHAFKFPALKKLVYSTCSVNAEENEDVVQTILKDKKIGDKFKLVKILPAWTRRGLNGLEQCVRADPNLDMCTGFFVAVFERMKHKKKSKQAEAEAKPEPTPEPPKKNLKANAKAPEKDVKAPAAKSVVWSPSQSTKASRVNEPSPGLKMARSLQTPKQSSLAAKKAKRTGNDRDEDGLIGEGALPRAANARKNKYDRREEGEDEDEAFHRMAQSVEEDTRRERRAKDKASGKEVKDQKKPWNRPFTPEEMKRIPQGMKNKMERNTKKRAERARRREGDEDMRSLLGLPSTRKKRKKFDDSDPDG